MSETKEKIGTAVGGAGGTAAGESIEAACLNAVYLEKSAEVQFMASMLLLSRTIHKDFQSPQIYMPPAQRNGEDNMARLRNREWDFYISKLNRYLQE